MKKQDLLVFLLICLTALSFQFPESHTKNSDSGIPTSITDLRNLSNLVIRGYFLDLESDSDLVEIHVDAVYKGKCGEIVYIRRLELQNLGQFDNGDLILFLRPLGKINSLMGSCSVYNIVDEQVFNCVELMKDTQSHFSINGMLLCDFIEKYLTP